MNINILKVYFIFFPVLISGCMFSPGQHMDVNQIAGDGSAESARIELITITPKFMDVQKKVSVSQEKEEEKLASIINYKPENYKIGPGDLLYITVWDHPELTAPSGAMQQPEANGRLVRPDGTLFYPYIGQIQAAGLTMEELRSNISKHLSWYIEDPQVDVSVLKFNSQKVILSGAFKELDPIYLTDVPVTLAEAISKSGIDYETADRASLTLIRGKDTYTIDIDSVNRDPESSFLHQIILKNGDNLHLKYNDSKTVTVLGEVVYPRVIPFTKSKMTLSDAIGGVGGINQEKADGDALYVIRPNQDTTSGLVKIYQLRAKSPAAYMLASQFEVYPDDIVYVGSSDIVRWNKVISNILPSSSIVYNAARTRESNNNADD